jgi:hypothetical protein
MKSFPTFFQINQIVGLISLVLVSSSVVELQVSQNENDQMKLNLNDYMAINKGFDGVYILFTKYINIYLYIY